MRDANNDAGNEWQISCNLLSNMYICKPVREAIENWKTLISEDIPDFMLDLKNAIDDINLYSEQELEDLLWEYTRLFIGPYKLPSPPWESVYTSGKRLMMQEAYDEVRSLYNEMGLKMDHSDVKADHIGAELNFLAILFDRMNGDIQKRAYYMDIAKRFLDEHLMRWVPQFTLDMEEAAGSPLYKALAHSTREFIINECNFFEQVTSP